MNKYRPNILDIRDSPIFSMFYYCSFHFYFDKDKEIYFNTGLLKNYINKFLEEGDYSNL